MPDDANEGAGERRYGGATAAERKAGRHRKLIRAAIATYGEHGYRQTTVSAVCRAAGLTPRYFYEAFDNSEALLAAAFREVSEFVMARIVEAGRAAAQDPEGRLAAMLVAYYELLRDEPATARVFLLEMTGISARIDETLARSLGAFADLIARTLDPADPGGGGTPLVRAGVMHGLLHVARDWAVRGYEEPVEIVVQTALPFCRMLRAGRQDRA